MYTEQSFTIPLLKGISEQTIAEHKKLYAGYVKHANLVQEKLTAYQGDETKVYEIGELYRRFSFEYNGMRNHEVYFNLFSGDGSPSLSTNAPQLTAAIERQWSSIDAWKGAFTTLALTRGIGWAMLSHDMTSGSLIMHWVDEQHLGQLQQTIPIIALDMWEHSYVADYQPSGKKQYVVDFLSQMKWSIAEANFQTARHTR